MLTLVSPYYCTRMLNHQVNLSTFSFINEDETEALVQTLGERERERLTDFRRLLNSTSADRETLY